MQNEKKFTPAIHLSCDRELNTHAQNLVTNGSFESDFANWTNLAGGGSSATFSIETTNVQNGAKAMKVAVTTPGANAYDVQSINMAWPSVAAKVYALTFLYKCCYTCRQATISYNKR